MASKLAVPWSLLRLFWCSAVAVQKASLILKTSSLSACSSMEISSQRGWCCSAQACSAIADFSTSPRLVAAWCSFKRVPKAIFVSPMYFFPQLHGTLYTTPALLSNGSTSFTLVSCRRSVDMVVNTVLISYLLQILLRSSLSPDTYGTHGWYTWGTPLPLLLFRSHCGFNYVFRISACSKDICQMLLLPLNMLCGCYSPGTMEQAGCHSHLLSTSFNFFFLFICWFRG